MPIVVPANGVRVDAGREAEADVVAVEDHARARRRDAGGALRRMSKYCSDGPAATDSQSLTLMPTTGFTLSEKILDERE